MWRKMAGTGACDGLTLQGHYKAKTGRRGVSALVADYHIGHATMAFRAVLRLCAVGWWALPTMADVITTLAKLR